MSPSASRGRLLPRTFFARPTLEVARDLVGLVLVRRLPAGPSAGRIVEVEAYIGETDPACHASAGRTPRTEPMYGPPGHAYVYFNYGMHHLINVVTEPAGRPAAVLIRALEPLDGLALMEERRARPGGPAPQLHSLCRGPGNLTRALGIDLADNRADLTCRPARGPGVWIEDRGLAPQAVAWSPRVGIRVGTDRLWRCYVRDSRFVSGERGDRRQKTEDRRGRAVTLPSP